MTSVSSSSNAALMILQQVKPPAPGEGHKTKVESAVDKIAAIAQKISGGDSAAKTQAADTINKAMLDADQSKVEMVSKGLAYLDSDGFRTDNPTARDTLKKLLSGDQGGKFALLVKIEQANKPGISDENAMAIAFSSLIENNRSQFGQDEFLIGFKFSNGGGIGWNVEDVNGNSTTKRINEAKRNLSDQMKPLFERMRNEIDSESTEDSSSCNTLSDLLDETIKLSFELNEFDSWLLR